MNDIITFTELSDLIDTFLIHTNVEVENFHTKCEEMRFRDVEISSVLQTLNILQTILNKYVLAHNYTNLLLNFSDTNLSSIEKAIKPIETRFAMCGDYHNEPYDPLRKPM